MDAKVSLKSFMFFLLLQFLVLRNVCLQKACCLLGLLQEACVQYFLKFHQASLNTLRKIRNLFQLK